MIGPIQTVSGVAQLLSVDPLSPLKKAPSASGVGSAIPPSEVALATPSSITVLGASNPFTLLTYNVTNPVQPFIPFSVSGLSAAQQKQFALSLGLSANATSTDLTNAINALLTPANPATEMVRVLSGVFANQPSLNSSPVQSFIPSFSVSGLTAAQQQQFALSLGLSANATSTDLTNAINSLLTPANPVNEIVGVLTGVFASQASLNSSPAQSFIPSFSVSGLTAAQQQQFALSLGLSANATSTDLTNAINALLTPANPSVAPLTEVPLVTEKTIQTAPIPVTTTASSGATTAATPTVAATATTLTVATTAVTPTVATTTTTPTVATTAVTPTVATTTTTPTVATTAATPTVATTAATPTVATTAATPTVATTAVTPTVATTAVTPTVATTAATPTVVTTAATPTVATTATTPTVATTAVTPTVVTTAATPTVATTAVTPTVATTAATPTAATTAVTPTVATTAATPTVATTAATPTVATTAATPTVATTAATPTVATTAATPTVATTATTPTVATTAATPTVATTATTPTVATTAVTPTVATTAATPTVATTAATPTVATTAATPTAATTATTPTVATTAATPTAATTDATATVATTAATPTVATTDATPTAATTATTPTKITTSAVYPSAPASADLSSSNYVLPFDTAESVLQSLLVEAPAHLLSIANQVMATYAAPATIYQLQARVDQPPQAIVTNHLPETFYTTNPVIRPVIRVAPSHERYSKPVHATRRK